MKGLLITVLILVILGMLKIGVRVQYLEKQLTVTLLISRWKLVLLGREKKKKPTKPVKVKEKAEKKKLQKPAAKAASVSGAPQKPKQKGKLKPWIQAVMEYWREIFDIIGKVLTSPTLDDLQLEIRIGGDPEKCAMTYGKICAAVGAVLPVVENTFRIRKRRIELYPCFDREDLQIAADVSITIQIYEIMALVVALLGLGLKIFLKARNNKKAVQQYESSSP